MKYEDLNRYLDELGIMGIYPPWVQIVDKVGTKYAGYMASYSETAVILKEHWNHNKLRQATLINTKDILSIQVSDDFVEEAKQPDIIDETPESRLRAEMGIPS